MPRTFSTSVFSRFVGDPGSTMGDSDTRIGYDPAGFGYAGSDFGNDQG